MQPTTLLKVVAVIMILGGLAHLWGHYAAKADVGLTSERNVALQAMASNQFDVMGLTRSYLDFYDGFSLSFSILFVMLGVLNWSVASGVGQNVNVLRMPLLANLAGMGVFFGISYRYLIYNTTIMSALIFLTCLWALLQIPDKKKEG